MGADAGYRALRGGGLAAGEAAPADLSYIVGKPSRELPSGLLRADVRAFKSDSGSDYHGAFQAALEAADAVYVPPGIWPTSQTVVVGPGKVLWSDAAYDRQQIPAAGAIIRASTAMPAVVRMAAEGATLTGVTVDGADTADAALELAGDSIDLSDASARRGRSYALKASGNFCTIRGGLFQQSSNRGVSLFQEGSDLLLWGARIKRGEVPLWIAGSGGLLGVLHVTGVAASGGSQATVKVTGPRNLLMNVYYDTAVGPSLLLQAGASGNRFLGMSIRNRYSGGTVPVIRCDATSGPVRDNHFAGFLTDAGDGQGWTYLLELAGPGPALTGTVVGDGHADGCRSLWNIRPAMVGDIATDGLLSRSGGSVGLGPAQATVIIRHGLKGRPRTVSVTLSSGGAPPPDIRVDERLLTLSWTGPPGALTAYWHAEL